MRCNTFRGLVIGWGALRFSHGVLAPPCCSGLLRDSAAFRCRQPLRARLRSSLTGPHLVRLLVCGVLNFASCYPGDGYSAPDRIGRALLALRPLGHG